ncbi:MAG: tRNA (cytosine(48)-C(5))-methyltransferase [Candidatus Methanofastidiosum methylothiophilum]|uniref:tRNA (Cytosine(48)-C(5))-methyltransferase n=1 Tax=Candidatus Methanofastidiosum methylothiophilum TaxID=1705564 RepID=A0A150IU42_9EURY|nr:MAG: tRNA (cytosine(48)-C(5))-methyltransferase [Candidatus Methanofastidiosum methylthiophilus]KYC48529.1 MAG: tRNA (cytosine(48)-C(5))-methyltransferase [Candidatus Methanofastidiosum methylthiophilus]KYC51301.1 MAG: tRNA (cytosine(48)-C(5))-methyltransferase [Candidatus Methanofastidiosum methylthiophilus]
MFVDLMKLSDVAREYGYNFDNLKRYNDMFGEKLPEFLEANEKENKDSIRVNTIKISRNELYERLTEKGFSLKGIHDFGFTIEESKFSISSTEENLLGYFYIQGVAEMIVSPILSPTKDDFVVDMCAAPGGKTTHLSSIMENEGVIYAFDINKRRLSALKNNIARLGCLNIAVFNLSGEQITKINQAPDKILLDAPCTGSGIMRKDSLRKSLKTTHDVIFLSEIQKKLLKAAIDSLKSGGTLLYTTCSLEPEENEFVIQWALDNFDINLMKIDTDIDGIPLEKGFTEIFGRKLSDEISLCRRSLPHIHNTNGLFMAKISKS